MRVINTLFYLLAILPFATLAQPQAGDVLPHWSEGYLDLHHINTGRGECLFAIFPDGTTMMVDAGETGTDKRNFKPNGSRSAGEWIARYIQHVTQPLDDKTIDYMLLTHFHDDHMGSLAHAGRPSADGGYILSGITEVGDRLPFKTLIDRGYPDYNWPKPLDQDPDIQNYRQFVRHHLRKGGQAAQFQVGTDQQFTLSKAPHSYPTFKVRNIAANGLIWTGKGEETSSHIPPIDQLQTADYPGENTLSTVFKISYGKFDYFNGADIVDTEKPGLWGNIEEPIGQVTGPVDVCEVNHHGKTAMSAAFIAAVTPRVFLIQGFALTHPDVPALSNMLSRSIYPDERDVFTTNLLAPNRVTLGPDLVSQLKSTQGHILVRVAPGGDTYSIYILDDSAESYTIKSVHHYTSK